MDPKEDDFQAKKEAESKYPKITSSSRHWSSYKNPRIVRVSRAFGGKDRHSKVCTLRGLRDRRIRLSVPTAIQLYDLQDKLGLGQPSKVVEWLLDTTKGDIDKLPPLPSLNFTQFQESCASTSQSFPPHCFLTPNQQKNLGLFEGGIKVNDQGENKWMDQVNQEAGLGGFVAQNLFPLSNTSFPSSYPNMHYNPSNTFNWNLPNLSLSHSGGGFSLPARTDDHLSIASSPHPCFGPFGMNTPSVFPSFPSYFTASSDNHDTRQVNQNPFMPTTLHLIGSKAAFPQENDTRK